MSLFPKRTKNKPQRTRSAQRIIKILFASFGLILFVLQASACGRKPDRLLEEAREDWRREDYKKAAALYERFLQQSGNSTNLQARYELADTYLLNLKDY